MTSYENMESDRRPHEIFVENSLLRDQNEEYIRQQARLDRHPSIFQKFTGNKCCECVMKPAVKFLIICLMIVAAIVAYSAIQIRQDSTLESLVSPEKQTGESESAGYQIELEIGQNQAYSDCHGSQLKQSFPDLDYAFLGYNILRGFPLAIGHDPGFTYPIFKADYSAGLQSADCRYSVPSGLIVIPDVSCATSFSSTAIQTAYQFSRSMSSYIKSSISSWGQKFSASAKYRNSLSKISSGESVYILSTAKCNYYFSKLVGGDAPKFDDVFITWIQKLNAAEWDPNLYFSFFETFGTHFATEITFGARYTYEYKMSSSYYERQREAGVKLRSVASSSGLFGLWKLKVETGFSLKQKQRITEFRESVETKTMTVGASPPENGDAMTWASEVKINPVPTAYKLVSIENLFTDKYMKSLNIDYDRIHKNIINHKMEYCLFLQKKGEVESCEDLIAGIELKNTRLLGHYKEKAVSSVSDCIDTCLEDIDCEAVSFCTTCTKKTSRYNTCFLMQNEGHDVTAEKTEQPSYEWQSHVFPGKIELELKLHSVSVIGVPRSFESEDDKMADLEKCKKLCIQDAYCSTYSYCNCSDKVSKCKMYSNERIAGLQKEASTDTYFISSRLDSFNASTTTPQYPTSASS